MSASISALIALACASAPYGDVCATTAAASAEQAGVSQVVDAAEDRAKSAARKEAEGTIGKAGTQALLTSFSALQFASGKSVRVKMRSNFMCDTVQAEGSKKEGSLTLGWGF